jgi:hypothetical protein
VFATAPIFLDLNPDDDASEGKSKEDTDNQGAGE